MNRLNIGIHLFQSHIIQNAPGGIPVAGLQMEFPEGLHPVRGVVHGFQDTSVQAFLINPLGIVLAVLMTVVPVWLLLDAVRGRSTLYVFFNRVDQTLRRRAAFIAFAGLVLANWCWNLFKGI